MSDASVVCCHIDCSRGVCEKSLLAATLDAAFDGDMEEAQSWIQRFVQSVGEHFHDHANDIISPTLSRDAVDGSLVLEFQLSDDNVASNIKSLSFENVKEYLESQDPKNSIPHQVKRACLEIFSELFKAEVKVAGEGSTNSIQPMSILCVLGIALTLQSKLGGGFSRISCSPIPIQDSVTSSSPKEITQFRIVQELLLGMAVEPANDSKDYEQVSSTPLGVAIVRVLSGVHLSKRCRKKPMILQAKGYGKSYKTNRAISVLMGELDAETGLNSEGHHEPTAAHYLSQLWISDTITHLESNLDDTTGENLAYVIELLLNHGAIDVWVTPIVMKKGRPAHTLHCLCKSGNPDGDEKVKALLELIFRHTTTLGVRIYRDLPRAKLCRSMMTVQTPYQDTTRKGMVDIKVSKFKTGEIVSTKAEFDHCKEISKETGVPLKRVAESAILAMRDLDK